MRRSTAWRRQVDGRTRNQRPREHKALPQLTPGGRAWGPGWGGRCPPSPTPSRVTTPLRKPETGRGSPALPGAGTVPVCGSKPAPASRGLGGDELARRPPAVGPHPGSPPPSVHPERTLAAEAGDVLDVETHTGAAPVATPARDRRQATPRGPRSPCLCLRGARRPRSPHGANGRRRPAQGLAGASACSPESASDGRDGPGARAGAGRLTDPQSLAPLRGAGPGTGVGRSPPGVLSRRTPSLGFLIVCCCG